jgi:DnaK suppressor protein
MKSATNTRGLLELQQAELSEELERLTAVPLDPMTPVSFGKRVGDGTTEAVERINKVGVADSLASKLKDVERALAKLDEGSYGECDSCGMPIPSARLEAMPWATLCVDCSASKSA